MRKYNLQNILIKLSELRLGFLTLFFVGVAGDVFFMRLPSDGRLLLLILLWIYVARLYKFGSSVTFKVALGFVGVLFVVFVLSRDNYSSERIATWIYFFLIIGLGQQFKELTS